MATNHWNIDTDDYDIFSEPGEVTESRPGSPTIDEQGHIHREEYFFPLSTTPNSTMDQDPNNTGPTNDFWTDYPISIDINGFIFYNGENTGINVRGPAGISGITWDSLTPEQQQQLIPRDGVDGTDGAPGRDGADGAPGSSAYEVWLAENGWSDDPEHHPPSDFFQYLADIANALIIEGTGTGSVKFNFGGQYNLAGGRGAVAAGEGTQANGNYSFAMGSHVTASEQCQVVLGKYNSNQNFNILEIGNGTDDDNRLNIFTIGYNGNIFSSGEISDGNNNILSNKVDKETGKQLSTNDFDNNYKNFIDNYHADSALDIYSTNVVQNKPVAEAINDLRNLNIKPTQSSTVANENLSFYYPTNTSSATLDAAYYTTSLTWNPYKGNLITNSNSISNNATNVFLFGKGISANADNQFILGQYNNPNSSDVFEIGGGSSSVTLSNLLRLTNQGNLIISGDIIDGNNNTLSDKQDLLEYDNIPTQNSTNLVDSGHLYSYLLSHGIDPDTGLIIPELATLQNQITALQTRVSTLETQVYELQHQTILIQDDIEINDIYNLGIANGKLYIKLQEEEEENNNEQIEEVEE